MASPGSDPRFCILPPRLRTVQYFHHAAQTFIGKQAAGIRLICLPVLRTFCRTYDQRIHNPSADRRPWSVDNFSPGVAVYSRLPSTSAALYKCPATLDRRYRNSRGFYRRQYSGPVAFYRWIPTLRWRVDRRDNRRRRIPLNNTRYLPSLWSTCLGSSWLQEKRQTSGGTKE